MILFGFGLNPSGAPVVGTEPRPLGVCPIGSEIAAHDNFSVHLHRDART